MFNRATQRTYPQQQVMRMNLIPQPRPPVIPEERKGVPAIYAEGVGSVVAPTKMKWGAPTWFFLHTIAHKIHPETFGEIRMELLKMIYTICTNLPCPDCSQHATTYLNGINFNTIQSREDLQIMLFTFHNSLNIKKGFVMFTREQLVGKYALANTANIFNHFITVYADKSKSIKMIAEEMYRARIVEQVRAWFLSHTTYFDG